jgi:hypothetical protein
MSPKGNYKQFVFYRSVGWSRREWVSEGERMAAKSTKKGQLQARLDNWIIDFSFQCCFKSFCHLCKFEFPQQQKKIKPFHVLNPEANANVCGLSTRCIVFETSQRGESWVFVRSKKTLSDIKYLKSFYFSLVVLDSVYFSNIKYPSGEIFFT